MTRLAPVLMLMMLLTTAARAQAPDVAQPWRSLLDAAGVSALLAQTDSLINQEVSNLEKTPLGFTPAELKILREQLLRRLGPQRLQADIVSRLQQHMTAAQQQELLAMLQSPRVRFMQTLQAQLDDSRVREAMRSYKVQVKENAPNPRRVELLENLDSSLQQTSLEAELKVELRKQLLATVTQLKTHESFSESMLDDQLEEYRRDVEGKISRNALYAYLYLFKRTPSSQLQDLIRHYNSPAYEQFMALCHDTIQVSFRTAREQLLQDWRVAKQ